jgi:hypothetical protein
MGNGDDVQWEALTRRVVEEMWEWRLRHPRATLREIEAAVYERLEEVRALLRQSLALRLKEAEIPPHRAVAVPGVHAYPSEHSIAAGQTLRLHVSASVPYHLDICRLGPRFDDPDAEEILAAFPQQAPEPHPIYPGSYIHVEKGLEGEFTEGSVEIWVRPWNLLHTGAMLSQFDRPHNCGIALQITNRYEIVFYLGNGQEYDKAYEHVSDENVLKPGRWHHVVAVWNDREKRLYVDGRQIAQWTHAAQVQMPHAPLRLGAAAEDGKATDFLDADIALPVIYRRPLSEEDIAHRFADKGLHPPEEAAVLACWPLLEEGGEQVHDIGPQQRHGRIINHATWMIGGPSFDADVPRFAAYRPEQDVQRGHGLRLASDDLYDCRWPVRHEWKAPDDAKPGFYVARFRYLYDGVERINYVTFIVRYPQTGHQVPIAVLAATNTWRAYSSTPFVIPPPQRKQVWGIGGIANGPGDLPAYSFYRSHAAGQGTYQVGLRMPWPVASPYVLYGGSTEYSHLVRAERPLYAWLEQCGYDFDVISDLDLHRDPEILKNYRVLIIVGHNEYWSIPMYEGVQRYLQQGGNVINLSGNTLFWRVSFDLTNTVMECRKVDAPGNQMPPTSRGEAWHSQDRRRGGLMRECGYPAWRLLGLETLGYNDQENPKSFGPFIVTNSRHPFFCQPIDLGVRDGDRIGEVGEGRTPAVNGHEFDVRLSTLARLQQQPTPAGAKMPEDPPGIQLLADGVIRWKEGGAAFDYFMRPVQPQTDQGGEMIDWERPEGGRVFNAGTIGFAWAMLADQRLQGLLQNVLAHCGVPLPPRSGS